MEKTIYEVPQMRLFEVRASECLMVSGSYAPKASGQNMDIMDEEDW